MFETLHLGISVFLSFAAADGMTVIQHTQSVLFLMLQVIYRYTYGLVFEVFVVCMVERNHIHGAAKHVCFLESHCQS